MQNSDTDVVFFVVSLAPLQRGQRARYEVADSSTRLIAGARIIGGTSTLYRSRAIALKNECIEGSFWRNRKVQNKARRHGDLAHRAKMQRVLKAQRVFSWSKYEGMYA